MIGLWLGAQTTNLSQDEIRIVVENILLESDTESLDLSSFEEWLYLVDHPINLNSTTREELEQLCFLSSIQVENILFYLYENAPMLTIYELSLVEGLTQEDIEKLLFFVTVEPLRKRSYKFTRGRSTLISRVQSIYETPSGFLAKNDTISPAYVGDKYKIYHRYIYEVGKELSIGITTDKDSGEPMFNKDNGTMDFVSAHLFWQGDGRMKKLALGDFRFGFGQGLVMGSGFMSSKSLNITGVNSRNQGLKRYSSSAESGFFRGAGVAYQLGKLEVSTMLSYQKLDATLVDENGITKVNSIQTSGLHRTVKELESRNQLSELVGAVSTELHLRYLTLGVGCMSYQYDYPFSAKSDLYRFYTQPQQEGVMGSLFYRFSLKKSMFFGEISGSEQLNYGSLFGFLYQPDASIGFSFAYRNYSKSFNSPFGHSLSEGGRPAGEEGVYLGSKFSPFSIVDITVFVDWFRNSWLSYGINKPSEGIEYATLVNCQPSSIIAFDGRYSHKEKENNFTDNNIEQGIGVKVVDKLQLRMLYNPHKQWRFTSGWQINNTQFNGYTSQGTMLYEDVQFSTNNDKWQFSTRYGLFNSDDYTSRLYTYERDVLYAFSVPVFFDEGVRWYFNCSYKQSRSLQFWARISQTTYSNLKTISSGDNAILSNSKTEYKMQCQYRF